METNHIPVQVSEVQLSYKPTLKCSEMQKITSSADTYNVLLTSWDEGQIDFVEQFKIILLNRANKVLGILEISSGGIAGTVADPKVIFGAALKGCASSIILAHNHPSGNLKPSQSDINLTQKIAGGGGLLDIQVLDHMIISSEGFLSFADEGFL